MKWLRDPSQSNVDDLNNIGHQGNIYFRNKKRAYLKDKIDGLENSTMIKNIRKLYWGINDSKECYQSRTYIVEDETCYLGVDSCGEIIAYSN
jgi:hypothetical protein